MPHCGSFYTKAPWQSDRYLLRHSVCYERQIEQQQARIDEIMFEHCPDEMTKEQIERYTILMQCEGII